MSQDEPPKRGKGQAQSPKKAKPPEKLCHIADKIKIWDKKDKIHKNLCRRFGESLCGK